MLTDFGHILLFIIVGATALTLILFVSRLIRPHRPNEEKLSTYESGEAPIGNANIPFNMRFYVVALIFVLFEVELAFLFPWATVYANKDKIADTNGLWGWFALIEMLLFVGILALGLAYAWLKGYLDWVKPSINTKKNTINTALYEAVNERYK